MEELKTLGSLWPLEESTWHDLFS